MVIMTMMIAGREGESEEEKDNSGGKWSREGELMRMERRESRIGGRKARIKIILCKLSWIC